MHAAHPTCAHPLSTDIMQYIPTSADQPYHQHSAFHPNQFHPNQLHPNQFFPNQYIQDTEQQYTDHEQGQYHQTAEYLHQDAAEPRRETDSVFDFGIAQNGNVRSVQPQLLMMQGFPTSSTGNHITNPPPSNLIQAREGFAQHLDMDAIEEQNRLMDDGFNTTADISSLFLSSRKLYEEIDYSFIIKTYISFTHTSNLMARDVTNSFKRSIISSLKLVDSTSICRAMQYDVPQVDLVRFERRIENVYGGYSEWVKILQTLSFDEDATKEYLRSADSDFGNDVPTIKFVLDILEQIGAKSMSMTDTLRVYLLTNIKNVSSLIAVKAFLSEAMHATFNASDAANVFTACMADAPRFTPEQFAGDLAWFMEQVQVCTIFQDKIVFFLDTKESMLQWSRDIHKAEQNTGRVRLRLRVGAMSGGGSGGNGGSVSSGGSDSYTGDFTDVLHTQTPSSNTTPQLSLLQDDSLHGWAVRARIPPAISHKSKLLGYVLMSQISFADPADALRTHFANDGGIISSNMLNQRVIKPHADAIIEFLDLLTVHVTPFDELLAFRDECFVDFSKTDSKNLSWLKFLQLYVATYQNDGVWPNVWKHFCGVLSHQVLLALTAFKTKHKYAVEKVANICMQTEETAQKAIKDVN